MLTLLTALYTLGLLALGLYGLKVLLFTLGYLAVRSRRERADPLQAVPTVTVQLPIYNERQVAVRVIDAACRLNWPADRFEVQVLDDSTDDTREVVDAAAAAWRKQGVDIKVLRRADRDGYKAGALANGTGQARGELLAVLDADFEPAPDFLARTVPYFTPGVAAVQARWGHLNADSSLVTRIQAMALDGYFMVEQTVRSRLGLFVNFNGTAGIWHRDAVAAAGGWQGDTLAEDTDLSFRAQLAGWRVVFLPEVVIPAELPPTLMAFKRQQRRWATGTTQLLFKLGPRLWRAPCRPIVRWHAILTLGGHLMQPVTLAVFLGAPLLLAYRLGIPAALGLLAILALLPPIMYALALQSLYADWRRRMVVYPALVLLALGMSLNGTVAVARAVSRRRVAFERTPKFGTSVAARSTMGGSDYREPLDGIVWGEVILAAYALAGLLTVIARGRWGFIPLFLLFAGGHSLAAWLSIRPHVRVWLASWRRRRRRAPIREASAPASLGDAYVTPTAARSTSDRGIYR
jgi:cellulose synthase/poly-beta-1,6-N-acetylglucosamine synthase-like glycosyltransferase